MRSKFWAIVIILCSFLLGIEYFWFSRISSKIFGVELNYGWLVFLDNCFI